MNMKNIFQKIKNRRKKIEQDVVCISIDHNNNTTINPRNEQDQPRDDSFLSSNSLNGSNFAEEYTFKTIKTIEHLENNNMDIDEDTEVGEEEGEMVIVSDIVKDIANNSKRRNIPLQVEHIVLFNVRNMYNVQINLSDTYWNYQTFYNFWKNTVGACFFYVRSPIGSYEICKYEEIVLNRYTMIFVSS